MPNSPRFKSSIFLLDMAFSIEKCKRSMLYIYHFVLKNQLPLKNHAINKRGGNYYQLSKIRVLPATYFSRSFAGLKRTPHSFSKRFKSLRILMSPSFSAQ